MKKSFDLKNNLLIIDCGSTTTKGLFFKKNSDNKWHLLDYYNTATTVEAPENDVMIGVGKVKKHFESLYPNNSTTFLATSSAGGGLQVALIAVTKEISLATAKRSVLNAGAIISIELSCDDQISLEDKISLLEAARPDLIVLVGGFESADVVAMNDLTFILKESKILPRFGGDFKIPLIFAGTSSKAEYVKNELSNFYELKIINNIRENEETESLKDLQFAVHEIFLDSVMQHAPGYRNLKNAVDFPIVPTPQAVTFILTQFSSSTKTSLLCVDIGGATTDIYTIQLGSDVQRSVSANVGMSYSAAVVLKQAGVDSILKYLPKSFSKDEVETYIFNKSLFPTDVPTSQDFILIEQALCIAALKLAFLNHTKIISSNIKNERYNFTIAGIFGNQASLDYNFYDNVIASGGVLSHAPDVEKIPWIMSDGFTLAGVSYLYLDKIFMLPHLGILSEINSELSVELLQDVCLKLLGIFIAPISSEKFNKGTILCEVLISEIRSDNEMININKFQVFSGHREHLKLKLNKGSCLSLTPSHRSINLGAGPGKKITMVVKSKTDSIFVDGFRCL